MKAWPVSNWTDAGQIIDFIGDALEPGDMPEDVALEPARFFALLMSAGKFKEATYFIGHALPRYEGIVWATQSLLQVGVLDRAHPLTNAILRWIDGPNDELRRDIKALADAEKDYSPARMLGMAIFVSGGSISEVDLTPVLAPPNASARMASGAVLRAAYASGEPFMLMRKAAEIGAAMASQGAPA